MEDSRFKEIKSFSKKELPHQLHWFLKEDYFSNELIGLYFSEIEKFQHIAIESFNLFEKATEKIIKEKKLDYLNIPNFFHQTIEKSWEDRFNSPFLYGRFDVNGGLDGKDAKVIEFNADTCTTVPETILWQSIQVKEIPGNKVQFNFLKEDLKKTLSYFKTKINLPNPFILASSFGHPEDAQNCKVILDIAYEVGFNCFYSDLENVTFSEDEGIFFENNGGFQPVDIWFKLIPWDWMFNEEPKLARIISSILNKELAIVLNPAFTSIWQNKKFLTYITQNFPNNFISETYLNKSSMVSYVEKPVYGRMGENIKINSFGEVSTGGEFYQQEKIFQKYYPLMTDSDQYFYQLGIFYTHKPSAINFRAEEKKIITNDCEFMSHFII
jgi:glutathionylspermidine synthase